MSRWRELSEKPECGDDANIVDKSRPPSRTKTGQIAEPEADLPITEMGARNRLTVNVQMVEQNFRARVRPPSHAEMRARTRLTVNVQLVGQIAEPEFDLPGTQR